MMIAKRALLFLKHPSPTSNQTIRFHSPGTRRGNRIRRCSRADIFSRSGCRMSFRDSTRRRAARRGMRSGTRGRASVFTQGFLRQSLCSDTRRRSTMNEHTIRTTTDCLRARAGSATTFLMIVELVASSIELFSDASNAKASIL